MNHARFPNGEYRPLSNEERKNREVLPADVALYRLDNLASQGATPSGSLPFRFEGKDYSPGYKNHWKTTIDGMNALTRAHRIQASTNSIQYILVGISPKDPATILLASLFLVVVTLVAIIVPALRASHVDPLVALRSE